MSLGQILVFGLTALLAGWVLPRRWRLWALLAVSIASAYWLQSSSPIRNLDFWLPTASIALTALVWAVTSAEDSPTRRNDLAAALVILGVILAIGLTRYLAPLCCLTPTRPPELLRIVVFLGVASVTAALPARLALPRRWLLAAAILLILFLFSILKGPGLSLAASGLLRQISGQPAGLASAVDLRWVGFSYLAFRLLHALRDRQIGRLPDYSLGEFAVYALFFPAYTAGPIDRSQRFIGELRDNEAQALRLDLTAISTGGWRILIGIFKKFVLADGLALIALGPQNASQVNGAGWTWLLLYAYALRIYFDFSGYTDIALGLAKWMGFNLPENFERPYLRQNLTAFWNSWHMTLAQWFRAYFFNPVTRFLRMHPEKLPTWAVILIGQAGTMLFTGLWHGLTWNFAVWGAWHGLGLFVHNRWAAWMRPRMVGLADHPRLQRALGFGGWLLTFHYVVLGWVWFALPNMEMAWMVFRKLFGG